jgi:hypothetical protein
MSDAPTILRDLQTVADERARRASDPAFAARVEAVKQYQHERFARTYADLLADARYADAARFFLDDLYGPRDYTERDAQFARIVPALARLFPPALVATVAELIELHALSERFDSALARALGGDTLDATMYLRAWQAAGDRAGRLRQIELMRSVGNALDGYTRNPLLRHSLKLMRAPARAAGLGALQTLLERGFDTFRALGGAGAFLDIITARERALVDRLFDATDATPYASDDPLAQLPRSEDPA